MTGLRDTLNENNVYAYAEIVKGLQAELKDLSVVVRLPQLTEYLAIVNQLKPILEAYSAVLTNDEVFTLAKQQDSLDDMLALLDTVVEDDPQEFYYYDPKRVIDIEEYPYQVADREIIFLTEVPLGYTIGTLIKLMEDVNYV